MRGSNKVPTLRADRGSFVIWCRWLWCTLWIVSITSSSKWTSSTTTAHAFVFSTLLSWNPSSIPSWPVLPQNTLPLQSWRSNLRLPTLSETHNDTTSSMGAILLQLQHSEQEMLHSNHSWQSDTLDPVNLSPVSNNVSSTASHTEPDDESLISAFDPAMALQLDKSVTTWVPLSSSKQLRDVVQSVLPLTPLQQQIRGHPPTTATRTHPSSTTSDTYQDQRYLMAISVALSIREASQYGGFVQQVGTGPLLECIAQEASVMRNEALHVPNHSAYLACQALSHLCSISTEVATLVTHDLLVHEKPSVSDNETLPSILEDMVLLLSKSPMTPWDDNANKSAFLLPSSLSTPVGVAPLRWKRSRQQHILQLFLSMVRVSDNAVRRLRSTPGFQAAVLQCSSFARSERARQRIRYDMAYIQFKMVSLWRRLRNFMHRRTLRQRRLEAPHFLSRRAMLASGPVRGLANQVLAAIGFNPWIRKVPGQRGIRILSLDGGGSRGMTSVLALQSIVQAMGHVEISDCFDMIVGTSTGAIIAFLVGIQQDTTRLTEQRYDAMVPTIFTKSALSRPMLLLTTATYNDTPFTKVLQDVLGEDCMLDSRADPTVPYVFAVSSKLSSTPSNVALFRNYNYAGGDLADGMTISPEQACRNLGMNEDQLKTPKDDSSGGPNDSTLRTVPVGSRHPGTFRVLQRHAVRASTAAPTFFKPVLLGGELYSDGGIVASNPAAIAIHEARTLFPDVPIEVVVSVGTGKFLEQKSPPRIGWDGIIGQIVNSACDGEQIHHILQDILGGDTSTSSMNQRSSGGVGGIHGTASVGTRYFRFNPVLGYQDDFPIDMTDPDELQGLKDTTREYMNSPEQRQKVNELVTILQGKREGIWKRTRRGIQRWWSRRIHPAR
eukprot:Nitzschia sp. Nitz4//scaffold116_size91068//37362//40118//NITZ4_004953-RA/size91068-augustus-gene-0.19-mRNA-1//1//CDS//3329533563//7984//frame0